MLANITYYYLGGLPLIVYFGMFTLLCFIFTAYIAVMNRKGNNKIPLVWHYRMAKISIALAVLHGLFGLLGYL